MSIQEQIFKAIDTITQNKIDGLKFDRLVEGIIQSDISEDGSYKFSFNGATYSAYPLSNTVKFKTGDIVYVMAIGGDFSKRKIIISTKTGPGGEMIDIKEELEKLNIYGKNYVSTDTSEGITLYSNGGLVTHELELGDGFIEAGIAQTNIRITAEIHSSLLELSNYPEGIDFGIELLIDYEDAEGETITKNYNLVMREMIGNVYQLSFAKQSDISDLELDAMAKSVRGLRLYLDKFPTGGSVTFKNVKIEYIQEILAEIIKDKPYTVNIDSDNGFIFKNGSIDTTLSISVFRGQYNVTEQIEDTLVTWTRKSSKANPSDGEWRKQGKSVKISSEDVKEKATFTCEIVGSGSSSVIARAQVTIADLYDTTTLQGYLNTNVPRLQLLKSSGSYSPDWHVQDTRTSNQGLRIEAALFKMGASENLLAGSSVPSNIDIIWMINIAGEKDDNEVLLGFREITEDDIAKYGIVKERPGVSKSIRITKNLMNEETPSFTIRAVFTYTNIDKTKEQLSVEADFGLSIQGTDGEKGAGYTVLLTNESHQVLTNLNGGIIEGEIGEQGRAFTNVEAYFEQAQLAAETPTQTGIPSKGHFQVRPLPSGGAAVAISPFDPSKIYVQALSENRVGVSIKVCIHGICTGDINTCKCPVKKFNLVKAALGATWLEVSEVALVLDENGTVAPNSITGLGKQRRFDGQEVEILSRFEVFGISADQTFSNKVYESATAESEFTFDVSNTLFAEYRGLKVVMLSNNEDTYERFEIDSQIVAFVKDGVSPVKTELFTPMGRVFKNKYQDGSVTSLPIEMIAVSGAMNIKHLISKYQWYYQDVNLEGWTAIHDMNGYVADNYTFNVQTPWLIQIGIDAVVGNETIKCVIDYKGETYESIVDITDYTDPYITQIQATEYSFKNGIGTSIMNCSIRQAEKEIDLKGDRFIYVWEKHRNGNKVYGYIPTPLADESSIWKHRIEFNDVPLLYKTTENPKEIQLIHPNFSEIKEKMIKVGDYILLKGQPNKANYITGFSENNILTLLNDTQIVPSDSEIFYGNFKLIRVNASEINEANTFYCNVFTLSDKVEEEEEGNISTAVVNDAIVNDAIVNTR